MKIFNLTAKTPTGDTISLKIRATGSAQAMGIADAHVSDNYNGLWLGWNAWTVTESRVACFTHEGCDGMADTHEVLAKLAAEGE